MGAGRAEREGSRGPEGAEVEGVGWGRGAERREEEGERGRADPGAVVDSGASLERERGTEDGEGVSDGSMRGQ